MSSIFVKHFELPCVERCCINKRALPCLALIKKAGKMIGTLPPSSLQEIFEEMVTKQGCKITCDPKHILYREFELL